ncbi:glycerophosphodiester phosphodiesterase [Natronorubrum sp. DTA28]|uniref:glycerophosphodiester phosphodiesterase n=1 Tax=Natronorubrum sp. DTA28 TaxID=3447019 RepID=UPI003F86BFF6
MPSPSHPTLSRRRLLAGAGAGLSALAVWGLSPLVTSGSLPDEPPEIVGHRGAEGLGPPNTMAAIQRALEVGVDGIELDVRRTSDGKLLLFHDPVLDWDSDGHGWIRNTPWADVRGAEIDGEPLIRLEPALERLAETDVSIYLEVKETGDTDAILETVDDYGLLDRTTIIGFDAAALEPARSRGVSTGLVGSTPTSQLATAAAECGADVAFCHYAPHLASTFVDEVRADGRTTGIWKLVDTEGTVRDALEVGPDVLVTNRPDYALEILGSTERDE